MVKANAATYKVDTAKIVLAVTSKAQPVKAASGDMMSGTRARSSKLVQSGADAERQLRTFIAKFDPPHQVLIRAVRRALRRRLPAAYELVYDNYNFLVIGYGPDERPSHAILSIAAGASGVGLCFIRGAALPDPQKILSGTGKQTRFLRLPSVSVLNQSAVVRLMEEAVARSVVAMPRGGRGPLIVRSISAKQRPRRKPVRVPKSGRRQPQR
jgi:Domain of unknown function (DU1801)